MAQADTKSKIKPDLSLKEPPLYKVIYLNDNFTPMDFVIETLQSYFNYSYDHSHKLTMDVHELGSATVAILPYEIAEQKGAEITVEARARKYPFQIKIEADL